MRLTESIGQQQRENAMKAAMVFSASGPILLLTSFDSLEHPILAQKLVASF